VHRTVTTTVTTDATRLLPSRQRMSSDGQNNFYMHHAHSYGPLQHTHVQDTSLFVLPIEHTSLSAPTCARLQYKSTHGSSGLPDRVA